MIVLFTHGGNWRRDARRLRASFARALPLLVHPYSFPSLILACLASLAALIFLVFFSPSHLRLTHSLYPLHYSFFAATKSTLFDETCVPSTLIRTIVSTLRSKSLETVRNFKQKYQIY